MAATDLTTNDTTRWKSEGQLILTWRRFRRHRRGMIGLIVLTLLVLGIIFMPYLLFFKSPNAVAWYEPTQPASINPKMWYAPAGTYDPSTGHLFLFGSDELGRDLLVRAFSAGRITLLVVVAATVIFMLVGILVGAIAGFYGGWVDVILMRLVDVMYVIPLLPAMLLAMRAFKALRIGQTITGPDPVFAMGVTIAVFVLFGWMGVSRLVRSSILRLRKQQFVEATRALGASNMRILFKHLLPNSAAPILVAATFALGDFIVWESIVAYFGQGITDPPITSWGNMLANALPNFQFFTNLNPFSEIRGYTILLPAFLIFMTILSVNFIGEGLHYALGMEQGKA